MCSATISLVFAVLVAQVLALPQVEQVGTASSAVTAVPICTHIIFKQPSFGRVCTSHSSTLTYTSYTNCGVGCTLSTRQFGVGLPCRTVRFNPGNTATMVTSCSPITAMTTTTKTVTKHARHTGELPFLFSGGLLIWSSHFEFVEAPRRGCSSILRYRDMRFMWSQSLVGEGIRVQGLCMYLDQGDRISLKGFAASSNASWMHFCFLLSLYVDVVMRGRGRAWVRHAQNLS
ncbi:uncharacterized protein M421DRAFT_87981 [Didymella exigua CBS 183.55]|uniref:Cyanovirin-N domain-containing protein n=1 Tax=Didymella exigua CBS 183.55 TaxID=1150837 RepID=A0A6A5RZR9_9PLEO|nr:uncharacterized protein M421DRAFT_87981 [Didymella exigua CBS 183.55]KAF1933911.1 hypothetical protein M421DRAFT_87981 [Didymella exigua CBS 183.55]